MLCSTRALSFDGAPQSTSPIRIHHATTSVKEPEPTHVTPATSLLIPTFVVYRARYPSQCRFVIRMIAHCGYIPYQRKSIDPTKIQEGRTLSARGTSRLPPTYFRLVSLYSFLHRIFLSWTQRSTISHEPIYYIVFFFIGEVAMHHFRK